MPGALARVNAVGPLFVAVAPHTRETRECPDSEGRISSRRPRHPPLPKRVRFALDPTTSHDTHLAGALGSGFVPFWRQAELEHGPPRFIRGGPQPSSVRFDD